MTLPINDLYLGNVMKRGMHHSRSLDLREEMMVQEPTDKLLGS